MTFSPSLSVASMPLKDKKFEWIYYINLLTITLPTA